MAEERPGAWFGFGFCGFQQELGSSPGFRMVASPEPLRAPGAEICRVSASWSYTALVTRGGRMLLSGSVSGVVDSCADAWASEVALVVLRTGAGPGAELQVWAPSSPALGEPLWAQVLEPEAEGDLGPDAEVPSTRLPLLPGACAYVTCRLPFLKPLAPELRARQLELGVEHALMLGIAGQVFSWGGGRHGQLGHGTLEAESKPRPLEALQGLPMAEVAAGGWHSVCLSETGDIYIWGWNEFGQLALPSRSLAEDSALHHHYHYFCCFSEASRPTQDDSGVKGAAGGEGEGSDPFIAVQPFPALLDLPMGSEAVQVSCGSQHTAVVTRTGELYTWGWGKYGQLGHKDTASLDHPCRVEYFVDQQLHVKTVTCGPWNTYVYAVEKGKS
ncbi:PREDICTED: RCC1 domain-containing protein 1 [Elephantulus edwardii]|uniref:RCC1 domain-containing protein 1 n=1 Tax=Elephantulus edwardii TaxID=28737 RepID=UPI0003F07A28|nr:PREDICTED: RCC1 domain-containing protein 1 [Elephantulus edwardii]